MKKIILTLSVIVISASIYGQELSQDTSKKDFRNVIGLNITGLLGQIGFINTYDYYPYPYNYLSSPYMLTYKRIYKKNAIRFGIGGTVLNSNSKNNDTLNGKSKSNYLNIGLGCEHYGYISKKWTFYCGIDAIGSYFYNLYQYDYSSNSNRKETNTTYKYGVSPLFGLMFRFNKRISIATETCYDITYTQSEYEYSYTNSSYNNSHNKITGFETQYHAPSTIVIRIQF